ncbi:helix-turn-helix domain-containing protein [Paenibacillus antri]|uniref:Helix-turn-helix domain-containing protein n=1 Tax=Paenibacillus antri TaxID=2582848 RepID=A0A5R9G3M6_9BACL|nr:AraC family transcriptional regulator [Paenibacillus antri]TLS49589.1 helix-turn-helix domain-containing protein [Paenibacillus antri]
MSTLIAEAPTCLYAAEVRKRIGEPSVYPLHRHEDHGELLLIIEGEARYVVDRSPFVARQGDLVFFPPGVWHQEASEPSAPFRFYYLGHQGLRVAGLAPDRFDEPGKPCLLPTRDRFPAMKAAFERLIEEFGDAAPEYQEAVDALLRLLVVDVLRLLRYPDRAAGRPAPDRTARLAALFMNDRYSLPLTLDDIASAVHLSPFHLSRLFRRETGLSPIQYLIRCRIEAAKRLLLTTDDSVDKIAASVGYESPTAFHRQFKRATGASPGKYRKDLLTFNNQV